MTLDQKAQGSNGGTPDATERLQALSPRIREMLQITRDVTAGILNEAQEEARQREEEAARQVAAAQAEARRELELARERAEHLPNERVERVVALVDELNEQVERMNVEADRLRSALAAATDQLLAELGVSPPQVDTDAEHASHEEAAGDGEVSDHTLKAKLRRFVAAKPDGDDDQSEEIERAALQMIAAGEDPSVIEKRLTSEFGVEDPEALLDSLGVQLPS